MITATLGMPNENGKNYSGEKPLIAAYSVVGVDSEGTLREAVACRLYSTPRSLPVYASVWIKGAPNRTTRARLYCSGTGKAGGGGYHKQSAAVEEALQSAGFTLSEEVGGRGDEAMQAALEAAARAVGFTGELLLIRHS